MSAPTVISADVLRVDAAREVERISSRIRDIVFLQLKRKGIVVARLRRDRQQRGGLSVRPSRR